MDSSSKYLDIVFPSIKRQSYTNIETNVLDNSSALISRSLRHFGLPNLRVYFNASPSGFCRNHNILLGKSTGQFLLILNPDVILKEDYLESLMPFFQSFKVAAVTGTLLRLDLSDGLKFTNVVDTQGMGLSVFQRHYDINADKILPSELGASNAEEVWGVSGAALLVRKSALDDVRLDSGEYFDDRFFMGREDADLAYRLRARGWKAIHVPRVISYHERGTKENRRREKSAFYNYHQVKNRYIMRFNNISLGVLLLLLPFFILRDFEILVYSLFFERGSLRSFSWVLHNLRDLIRKRKEIQGRRTSTFLDELSWYFKRIGRST